MKQKLKIEMLKKRADQIKDKIPKSINLLQKMLRMIHSKSIFQKLYVINDKKNKKARQETKQENKDQKVKKEFEKEEQTTPTH